MTIANSVTAFNLQFHLQQAGQYIKSCQHDDGAIIWDKNGKLDPWNHVEAAMALATLGYLDRAKLAYLWLENCQNLDGSWYAEYRLYDKKVSDPTKIETNFVAYIATGVWHYYLISGDREFLANLFPCVVKAINYVISQQSKEGDINWASSLSESLPKDALVTACSSILRSIECAIKISQTLDTKNSAWLSAYEKLYSALKYKSWRFDRTWESKARYSMDWFYPILAGLLSPQEITQRLNQRWQEFIVDGLGCRCVSDEPWVTVAESSELVLALVASGQRDKAIQVHQWLIHQQDTDGGFWTGYQFKEQVVWPQEKTSWTAAAFLLAADALYQLSPAHNLFTKPSEIVCD